MSYFIAGIVALAVIGFIAKEHHQYKKLWYVRYPDGLRSCAMDYHSAVGFKSMFGGDVIREEKEGEK